MTTRHNPACPHADGLYQSRSLPPDHRYQVLALVLQGGGALGSYQPGVYQGLAEADLHPNWVAGISIGALNAAIIAGNPPERRVEQLRVLGNHLPSANAAAQPVQPSGQPFLANGAERAGIGLGGVAGNDRGPERLLPTAALVARIRALADQLQRLRHHALEEHAGAVRDFDRINDSNQMRVSVGAVNLHNGNFVYFDNTHQRLRPEHFMASGALPPGFPAVEIDGEYYWDGGLVSNTPCSRCWPPSRARTR